MSHVETIQNVYAAFGRGDIPFILSVLAEDVIWEERTSATYAPWLKPGRGVGHVAAFFQIVGRDMEVQHFAVENVMGGGNQVAAIITSRILYKPTGKLIEDYELHLWTFGADGKVSAFKHFIDTVHHQQVAQK